MTTASGKPKKKRIKGPGKGGPWKLQTGTRNELTEVRSFSTEADMRRGARKALEALKPWCERYNRAGLVAISDASSRFDNTVIVGAGQPSVECIYDEHTGAHIVLKFWKVN